MNLRFFCIFLSCIVLLSTSCTSGEESTSDPEKNSIENEYLLQAYAFSDEGKFDSAHHYYQLVLNAEERKNQALKFQALSGIADNYIKQGEVQNGLALLDSIQIPAQQSLGADHEVLGDIASSMGLGFYYAGESDDALKWFAESARIYTLQLGKDSRVVANAFTNQALCYHEKKHIHEAIQLTQQAVAIHKNIQNTSSFDLTIAYSNLGSYYGDLGEYERSIDYLEKSLRMHAEIYGEDHYGIATTLAHLSKTYRNAGDTSAARKCLERGLEIRLKQYGKEDLEISASYTSLGYFYGKTGQFAKQVEYYQKNLALQEKLAPDTPHLMGNAHHNLGMAYGNLGKYDLEIAHLEQGFAYWKDFYRQGHPRIARSHRAMGIHHLHTQNWTLALRSFQQALISLSPTFDEKDIALNPAPKNIYSESILAEVLPLKAEALFQRYQHESHQLEDLEFAAETQLLALLIVNQMKEKYQGQKAKMMLGNSSRSLFEKGIELQLKLYEVTGDVQFAEQAFMISSQSKANALVALQEETIAGRFAGIPDSLLAQERSIRIDLAYFETNIAKELSKGEKANHEKIDQWKDKRFMLSQDRTRLIEQFESNYPEYYRLKYTQNIYSIAEIQTQFLDSTTALIEYFSGDSLLHIFTLTKDEFHISTVDRDSNFEQSLSQFQQAINIQKTNAFPSISHRLYSYLIQPIAAHIQQKPRWIIIPDGHLYALPFEALLKELPAEATQITDYSKLDFLLKDHEISYHFSTRLMAEDRTENHASPQGFIGFAPLFTDNASTMAPLPYTEQEIEDICALFKSHGKEERSYIGDRATVEHFKAHSSGYRFVHLATHAVVNEKQEQLSALLFSGENGLDTLYANATYTLNFNADLLVLSSCESGLGKLVTGEGKLSLARGFLHSCTQNIVYSLWEVYDKYTSELMVEFYRNILQGKSYAASLREAKLKMLQNPATAFPQKWSGFVLIGK